MYIVNSTFSVDERLHAKWLALVTEHFIPFIKERHTGEITFSKLLNNEKGSHTYSLQIKADSVSFLSTYSQEIFSEYQKIADPLFGEGVLHFNSILKVIQ